MHTSAPIGHTWTLLATRRIKNRFHNTSLGYSVSKQLLTVIVFNIANFHRTKSPRWFDEGDWTRRPWPLDENEQKRDPKIFSCRAYRTLRNSVTRSGKLRDRESSRTMERYERLRVWTEYKHTRAHTTKDYYIIRELITRDKRSDLE